MSTAVIFDFDGTIADSFPYVFDFMWKEAGKNYAPSKSEITAYRQLPMRLMGRRMGMPYWKLLVLYFKGKRVMREHMSRVQPFSEVVEQIRLLHDAGCQLYIVSSNSRRTIGRFLAQHDLHHIFRAVYAGATPFGKNRLFKRLLRRHRLAASNCWAIGDLMTDAEAARACGLRTIAVTWGFDTPERLAAFADHLVDEPAEISNIILDEQN